MYFVGIIGILCGYELLDDHLYINNVHNSLIISLTISKILDIEAVRYDLLRQDVKLSNYLI